MLQMTVEQLNAYNVQNISKLVQKVEPYLRHRCKLYEKYARKSHENQFMSGRDSKGKEKAIVAFEYYIVNMVQGYLGGKAPMYSVSTPSNYALNRLPHHKLLSAVQKAVQKALANKEKINESKQEYIRHYTDAIEYIRRYNDDAATFVEIVHDYLITTAAYLYIFEDEENEIRYVRLDSRQTVAIYDYSTPMKIIGVVRKWNQMDDNGSEIEAVEIITGTIYRRINGEAELEPKPLHWGDVPCVSFEHPDGISIFEPALGEIAAYEQNLNNVKNMTKYNDNAKLLLSGYVFENPAFIQNDEGEMIPNPSRELEEKMIMNALALTVGEKGDIRWLVKSVDYSGIMETLKRYHELITMVTGVPNMTDEAFSNADNASALGYKLYALDQYSATFDRVAKKGYLRLWEIITNRLNLRGENFGFRDISIKLQRNIPTDKDKSLARALSAYQGGLISQETAIGESQMELDAKEEILRINAEQDADYLSVKTRANAAEAEQEEEKNNE